MDPNATISILLAASKDILKSWDDCNADGTLTADQLAYMAERSQSLAEAFAALDSWIVKGGFLPRRWQPRT